MKDIRAIRGRHYLQRLIDEGEHERQDFKFAISDARKIARSISAFANNSGGRLLVGVKDNGRIAGVRNEEDIYVIEQAAGMYCRPSQHVDFKAYRAEGDAVVVIATIPAATRRPVMSQEHDLTWNAYYRVADENILAPDIMVKAWRRRHSLRTTAPLTLGERELSLLGLIDRHGAVTLHDCITSTHLSSTTAEHVITTLYSMGIIDFRYQARTFHLVRSATAEGYGGQGSV